MADHFQYPASKRVVGLIDEVARTTASRATVFEDWLTMVACALTGGREEPTYMEVVGRHTRDNVGRLAAAFGELTKGMDDDPEADILGDVFTGGVSRGEAGQFFTPDAVCKLMAELTETGGGGFGCRVNDPACGSGRTLLAAARRNPLGYFVGQDIDRRCVMMTAANLALREFRGEVIHGSTLALECREVWVVGYDGVGLLRRVVPTSKAGEDHGAAIAVAGTKAADEYSGPRGGAEASPPGGGAGADRPKRAARKRRGRGDAGTQPPLFPDAE